MKAKLAIGLGIDSLSTTYHRALFSGVKTACRERDVNLVCFLTGQKPTPPEPDSCRNVLLELLATAELDGILLDSASIFSLVPEEETARLLESFTSVPAAFLGHRLPGKSISCLGGRDIQPLVRHLVHDHGYRRLAFIGGPSTDLHAQGRLFSFRQFCRDYGVDVPAHLIFAGDFLAGSGRKAMARILETCGTDLPEAIVCANDTMAFGVMEYLREHGIVPGWDIAVTGFDDFDASKYLGLTSMRQEIREDARLVCDALISRVMGLSYPDSVQVPDTLMIRQSCGCRHSHNESFLSIEGKRLAVPPDPENSLLEKELLYLGCRYINHPEIFMTQADQLLTRHLGQLPESEKKIVAGTASRIIRDVLRNSKLLEHMIHEFHVVALDNFANQIAGCFENSQLFSSIRDHLDSLKIPFLLVGSYKDPSRPVEGAHVLFIGGERLKPGSKTPPPGFTESCSSIDQMLHSRFFEVGKRGTYLVHGLFSGSEQIGYAVFGYDSKNYAIHEPLCKLYSIAIQQSRTVQALRQQAVNLEKLVQERTHKLQQELEERRRIQEGLRLREEHYRDIATLVPDVVVELDSRLQITFMNEACQQSFGGLRGSQSEGCPFFMDYIAEEARLSVHAILNRMLKSPSPETMQLEIPIQHTPGSPIVLAVKVRSFGRTLLKRRLYLSAVNVESLLHSMIEPIDVFFRQYHLSRRQREVFNLILVDRSIKEIAKELGISENTVKVHCHSIYTCTGTEGRKDLLKLIRQYQKFSTLNDRIVTGALTHFL